MNFPFWFSWEIFGFHLHFPLNDCFNLNFPRDEKTHAYFLSGDQHSVSSVTDLLACDVEKQRKSLKYHFLPCACNALNKFAARAVNGGEGNDERDELLSSFSPTLTRIIFNQTFDNSIKNICSIIAYWAQHAHK